MRRCVGSDRSAFSVAFHSLAGLQTATPSHFLLERVRRSYSCNTPVPFRSCDAPLTRASPSTTSPCVLLRRRPITCELFASPPLLSSSSPHGLASSTLLCPFSLATFILSLAPAARKTREVYYWRGVGRH